MPIVQGVPTVLEPPEGYVVDFDNPRRQGVPEAYYVSGFGMALSFLFIAQRLYVRCFLTGGLQIDDGECFPRVPCYSTAVGLLQFIYLLARFCGLSACVLRLGHWDRHADNRIVLLIFSYASTSNVFTKTALMTWSWCNGCQWLLWSPPIQLDAQLHPILLARTTCDGWC